MMDGVTAEYVLTSIPVVLERILGYLPIIDLHRVQSVCKAWKNSAENVIGTRQEYQCSELLSLFQEADEDKFVKFKRTTREMTWNTESEKYQHFLNWRNNWKHQPTTGVCVCLAGGRKRENTNLDTENLFRYWLPKGSKLLTLGTVDSAVCVDNQQTSKENDVFHAQRFYNYLSIPSKPDSFSVEFLNLKKNHSEDEHEKFFTSAREELTHPDTKMVLVCEQIHQHQHFPDFHEDILNPAARRGVVVIGCLYESSIVFSPDGSCATKDKSSQEILLMLFKGRNVRSASILVGSEIETVPDLETKLKKLQTTATEFSNSCPERCRNRTSAGYCYSCVSQTIGIMMACCARADSSEWYTGEDDDTDIEQYSRNKEQETFRRIIPNVPILGAFGMGEIGATINIASETEKIAPSDNLYRRESTVFGIVKLK